ncbi:MAG TPA: hypothetical protein VFQ80_15885, partial [Thermomicrobiales bacterium]|nr:hypothetical protein [Thermomicrobiales bacterium]
TPIAEINGFRVIAYSLLPARQVGRRRLDGAGGRFDHGRAMGCRSGIRRRSVGRGVRSEATVSAVAEHRPNNRLEFAESQ